MNSVNSYIIPCRVICLEFLYTGRVPMENYACSCLHELKSQSSNCIDKTTIYSLKHMENIAMNEPAITYQRRWNIYICVCVCDLNLLRSSSRARTVNSSAYICSHEIRTSNDPPSTRCKNKLRWIWLLSGVIITQRFSCMKGNRKCTDGMGVGEFSREILWAKRVLEYTDPLGPRLCRKKVLTVMHWWSAHQLKWVVFLRRRFWCSGIYVWLGLDTLYFS